MCLVQCKGAPPARVTSGQSTLAVWLKVYIVVRSLGQSTSLLLCSMIIKRAPSVLETLPNTSQSTRRSVDMPIAAVGLGDEGCELAWRSRPSGGQCPLHTTVAHIESPPNMSWMLLLMSEALEGLQGL